MQNLENALAVIGRVLLGLYFLIPGIRKITCFDGLAAYMEQHGMILVPFLSGGDLDSANWWRVIFNRRRQSALHRIHVCRDDTGYQRCYA